MKILFVSQAPLKKELGAAKVVIELAEEMERLGWECRLTSLMELVPGPIRDGGEVYATALGEHLRRHAGEFDVIDFDHCYLPFPRSEFSPATLLVARSVLLAHHLLSLRAPPDGGIKGRLRTLLAKRRDTNHLDRVVKRAQATLVEADLVNVANHGDETTLIEQGISKDKIVVLPYGLSRDRRVLFDTRTGITPMKPRIAFVGTFDSRKGANDLPEIVDRIAVELPEASFSLLGTSKDQRQVLGRFSKAVRDRVDVVPSYPAGSLHDLLVPCTAGIFPSYLEGFGFGILEMLAAGIPVIAYDVPGPPMMLPAEYLVDAGDRAAMSRRIVDLVKNRERLEAARTWARERSHDFEWPEIARQTSDLYLAKWQQKITR